MSESLRKLEEKILKRRAKAKQTQQPRQRLMEIIANRPRPLVTAWSELVRAKAYRIQNHSPKPMKKLSRADDYAT